MPHADRFERRQSSRSAPASGKQIGDIMIQRYLETHPQDIADPHKWQMFQEIVMHNAFDTAGNRYNRATDGTELSTFDKLFEDAEKAYRKNYEVIDGVPAPTEQEMKTGLFEQILAHLPSYTKGFVQTPHPTEVLSNDAIDAEQNLHMTLEHSRKFFNGKVHTEITAQELKPVLDAMKDLFTKITPIEESMSIDQEMARSIIFSEKMFDSIPHAMAMFMQSAERAGGFKPGDKLTDGQMMAFNFLIQPETWSPGDRDSKDLMTCEKLTSGIERSRRAMQLHYMKNIAGILTDKDFPDKGGEDNTIEVRKQLRDVLWKTMQGVTSDLVNKYIEERFCDAENRKWDEHVNLDRENLSKYPALAKLKELNDLRHKHKSADEYQKLSLNPNETKYESHADFLDDLQAIRSTPNVTFPAFVFKSDGEKTEYHAPFSKLDALYVQANNFGASALHTQIRENGEKHSDVIDTVIELLQKKHLLNADTTGVFDNFKAGEKDLDKRKFRANALIDLLMNPKYKTANKDLGLEIHDALDEKVRELETGGQVLGAPPEKPDPEKATPEQNAAYKRAVKDHSFYQTLKGFQIAAKDPQAITRYLIAECRGSGDMLEAFFMLKAMESNDTRDLKKDRQGNPIERVELVPLFEYRPQVNTTPDILEGAYKNPYFAEYSNGFTDQHHPALAKTKTMDEAHELYHKEGTDILPSGPFGLNIDVTPPELMVNPMTVAEAKNMYNIPVKPGDDQKQVKALKTVMYAGSDITKSSGCAGAGLVLHAANTVRESLLDRNPPILLVDYTGVGGGLHRSQPVTSAYETVQGRSMRQSDVNIAHKVVKLLCRHLSKRLGLEEKADPARIVEARDVVTAQTNLGNMAGLQYNEEQWKKEVEPRLTDQMKKYEGMYYAPEYSAYMGFTADPFVKLTSYAARPGARNRSSGDSKEFPPMVDVTNLRAIGYGAALNTAGSCVSYYFGHSQLLHLDEQGNIPAAETEKMRDLYLRDPIIQDTVNRATYGVVMANMDSAWTYLGCKRAVDDAGQVSITGPDGTTRSCADISANSDARETARQHLKDIKTNPKGFTEDDKKTIALNQLATIDMEYQRVSKGLLQLHRLAKSKAGAPIKQSDSSVEALTAMDGTQKDLLRELPKALREQIVESRVHLDPERKFLADLFDDCVKGTAKMPTRKKDDSGKWIISDPEAYGKIYHAMGAVLECFENVPRAYNRRHWVIAREQEATQAKAA